MGEAVYVSTDSKTCPTCGQELAASAGTCDACGARFEVYTRAYCAHCHQLIHATADGKCPGCAGSDLLDPRLYSQLTAAGIPPARSGAEATPEATAAGAVPALAGQPSAAAETRQCPRCAETIKAEARLCRFCGARFEVAVKGYCTNCHAEVSLNENDRCPRCAGEVIDRHIASTLLGEPAPAPTPVPFSAPPAPVSRPSAVAAPATVTTASAAAVSASPVIKIRMPFWQLYFSPKGRIGRLTFFLKGILAIFGAFFVLAMVLGLISGLVSTPANQEEILNITYGIIALFCIPFFWAWLMLIVKRLHDLDRSGWNIFVVLIPLVGQLIYLGMLIACFFVPGTGPNRFGDSAD